MNRQCNHTIWLDSASYCFCRGFEGSPFHCLSRTIWTANQSAGNRFHKFQSDYRKLRSPDQSFHFGGNVNILSIHVLTCSYYSGGCWTPGDILLQIRTFYISVVYVNTEHILRIISNIGIYSTRKQTMFEINRDKQGNGIPSDPLPKQ